MIISRFIGLSRHYLVLLFLALSGCGPAPKPVVDHSETPNIAAASADEQARFDAARADLSAGRNDTAERGFAALVTEDGATAEWSRVYLARIGAKKDPKSAANKLAELGEDERAARDVRIAALRYAAEIASTSATCRTVDRAVASLNDLKAHLPVPRLALARARCTEGAVRLPLLEPALADPSHEADGLALADAVIPKLSTSELVAAIDESKSPALSIRLRAALIGRPDADPTAIAEALAALPSDHPAAVAANARGQRARIGIILPLSGRSHRIGARLRDLVDILASEDDPEGGAELIVRDGGSPASAHAALESFAADKVDGVVGLFDRRSATAATQAATRTQIPIVMLTLSDEPLRVDAPVWRALDTPSMVARTAAGALLARNAKSVTIVSPDNAYGTTLADWFGRAWTAGGGEVAGQVEWPRRSADFAAVAKRIARIKSDAIFMPSDPTSGAQLLTHLAAEGVWGRGEKPRYAGEKGVREVYIISAPQWYTPQFLQQAGRYANNVLITVPFAAETARGARFNARVQKKLDRPAEAFDAFLADSVRGLIRARVAQRAEGGTLVSALKRVVVSDGATSGLRFSNRDAVPALFILQVQKGQFRPR